MSHTINTFFEDRVWSTAYLIDSIFNDLMDKSIEGKNGKNFNKYIYQAITKFQDLRIKSPVTFFDIYSKDIKENTKRQIKIYLKNCKSLGKAYQKFDGIITEVIALIFREAMPLIISTLEYEDPVWIEKRINEIRTTVSYKWEFL